MGAWAGFCPDGQQDVLQSVLTIPHAIVVDWHNGDSLMVAGDPFNSGYAYVLGFPSATIDRYDIGGTSEQMRPYESAVSARTSLTPNFQVDMTTSYNPVSRILSIVVTGKALSSLTGNWNINAIVAEDSVSSAYGPNNQVSLLNTTVTASNGMACWYNGLGSPIPAADYAHMDVARAVMATNIWGDAAFTNPVAGTTASRYYTYTLPTSFNASKIFVVGLVQKSGIAVGDSVVENAVSTKGNLIPPGTLSGSSDSMSAYTNDLCSTSEFFVTTHSWTSGLSIQTDFGDGSTASSAVLSAVSGGYADIYHNYTTSGTYTIKHVLLSGTSRLDSVTYSHTYVLCNQFPVMFYYDANSNCIKDSSESFVYQPFMTRVDSNGVTVDSISASCGFYYNAYGSAGDIYTFTVMSAPPGLSVSCPTTIADTIGADSSLAPKYFGTSCTTGSTFDLRIFPSTILGRHHFNSDILVDNTYCSGEPATVTMELSPLFSYMGYPAPTSISGSTLTWNIADLSSILPAPYHINVSGEVIGTWLTPGDTLHAHYHVDPVTGDVNPANNDTIRVDTSRSGYDPNYMEVVPAVYIAAGTTVTYTIDFENTGNDTAHNIYVMDTLSDNVLAPTVKLLSSTNKMFVTYLKDVAGQNIVKFDFPGINLPDSSHHNQCDGMVIFRVQTKPGLANGTLVSNHAGIFFDDNPVVMTNTVTDIIGLPNRVVTVQDKNTVAIYPNPVTDELTVSADHTALRSYTITNSIGQEYMSGQLDAGVIKVGVKTLPAGLYYLALRGDDGVVIRKFVKL